MGNMSRETYAAGLELEIIRDFDAPPEMVFDAWTNVDALKAWMGPVSRSCPNAEANPAVGGDYCFPMEADNGDTSTVVGTYTTIDRPTRLAFTWSWIQEDGSIGHPMHISLEFEPLSENRTRLKMLHVNLANEDSRASHNEGWIGCFICLDKHLHIA
ncbi:MAG: SRPBCC domain-containing protein [Sneathiella sp.]